MSKTSPDAPRIALIGAGLVGRQHLRAIASCPSAQLGCVVDPAGAPPEIRAPRFASIAEMLAAKVELDGAILATPNLHHLEGGLELIAAGLPVLIEKPIAASSADGWRLVEAAKERAVALAVGHHRRHSPKIAAAKALIDGGALGCILAVDAQCWLAKPAAYFEAKWRGAAGAGPMLINLVHDVDALRHLVGEIEEVAAFESRRARGGVNEDGAVAILRFAGGALGTLSLSDAVPSPWSWEMTAHENSAYDRADEAAYRLGGDRASLSLPDLTLWRHRGDGGWHAPIERQRMTAPAGDPLERQIAQFCAVIRGDEPPLVSGEEGVRSLEAIERIARAAAASG